MLRNFNPKPKTGANFTSIGVGEDYLIADWKSEGRSLKKNYIEPPYCAFQ